MSEKEDKKRAVALLTMNPKLSTLHVRLGLIAKASLERAKFVEKQRDQLIKDHEKQSKAVWEEITEEVHRLMPDHNDTNDNLEFDGGVLFSVKNGRNESGSDMLSQLL